jgi:uncharacterized protein (DUF342 family)
MNKEQLFQLLYEALETEMGGVQVYKTAIRCAVNEELKEEWEEYLEQTQKHEEIVRELRLDSGVMDRVAWDAGCDYSSRRGKGR